MKKRLVIILLMLSIISLNAQTKFNPASSTATPLTKSNFGEYKGFSYEVLAGMYLPLNYNFLYYGFGFYPRYNFIAPKDWLSLSAGSATCLGFDFGMGSYGTVLRYMFDIPMTLDLNIGARATAKNQSIFGVFIGGGFGYNFMHIAYNDQKLDLNTLGPVMHGGLRWSMNGRPSGIRFSYLTGFGTSASVQNGINVPATPGNRIFAFTFVYGI